MKITVFNGSPHAENGNTNVIVEEFLKGAKEAKAEIGSIFLAKKHIEHCFGCSSCWVKTPGRCIIKDDMEELLKKFISSDIVVFATPVYFDNVTGIMKNFIDRLTPLVDPHFEKDEKGECRHLKRYGRYPKFVVISNCGFPEQSHFRALRLLFKRMARSMHTEVIAEVFRSGGEFLKVTPFLFKPFFSIVRQAGKEVASNLRLSRKIILELRKSIFTDEQYMRFANQNWDELLSRLEEKK